MTRDMVLFLFGILLGFKDVKLSCVGIGKLYDSAAAVVVAVTVAREVYDEIGHGCYVHS